jgi:hypothetical protein
MGYGDKVSIHADDMKTHGENLEKLKEDYLDYSKDKELGKIDVKPGDFKDANDLKAKVNEIVTAAKTFLTNSGKGAADISQTVIDNAKYYKNTNTETTGTATDFDKIAKDVEKDLPGYGKAK